MRKLLLRTFTFLMRREKFKASRIIQVYVKLNIEEQKFVELNKVLGTEEEKI